MTRLTLHDQINTLWNASDHELTGKQLTLYLITCDYYSYALNHNPGLNYHSGENSERCTDIGYTSIKISVKQQRHYTHHIDLCFKAQSVINCKKFQSCNPLKVCLYRVYSCSSILPTLQEINSHRNSNSDILIITQSLLNFNPTCYQIFVKCS